MSEDYPGVELSDELIEHFRDTFDSFDLDEDGIVTYEELMTVSNRLGYCMSVDVVAVSGALFIQHRKLYGPCSFREARQMASTDYPGISMTPKQIERYRRKFECFDLDHDGIVTVQELETVSEELGYQMTKEELMETFGRVDLDECDGITFEEFLLRMQEKISKKDHKKAKIREKFMEFDKNNTGYVTAIDAHRILSKELGFPEKKTEALLHKYDKNHDNRLSIEEFAKFYTKVEDLKKQIHDAFKQIDIDGNGYIEMSEAKQVMRKWGFPEHEVEALVQTHDTNGDGQLDYEEFVHLWRIDI